ncbi:uncharacterized protein N7458_012308 [Penicillium daleae]|uniref:Uncharacterized protein n=1 Tax=Penicillium daleae TaxID=63821 RepID=A0AAD6BXI7_9EURO|nr:uncharacterized protein N7458_012308 [Penicillium daleae]KAJ5433152.1 hypothetical protein N7458_012308 [Penicillium daleae]
MKNPPGAMALDIHLPLLESLELRSCGFTCNDTLNGIIKHGSTLLSLKFDDCAIIYCMELAVTSKAEPNSVCISTENEGGRVYQRYWLRWDIWFQALAYGLPHLKRFDFGSSRVRALGEEGPKFKSEASEGPKFGRVNKFLFGLFPDRYLEMKDGSVRAPWILKTRGQRPYYKEPPVADEPDLAMLRRLLEHTGQVVQENDKSSHASSVDSLIGCVETRSGRRRR